jgi:hypothetical protein
MWLTRMPIPTIIFFTLWLWLTWECLYRILRHINFHQYD